MAKIRFRVDYNMRFPDGSSVTRGFIVLDDKKHSALVEMLDASKGAHREEAKAEVQTAVAVDSVGEVLEPAEEEEPKVEAPDEPAAEEEPDWKFMQKSELKKWILTTDVKAPRENASHKSLVEACQRAWKDGARPTE